jgi:hypothetical protein
MHTASMVPVRADRPVVRSILLIAAGAVLGPVASAVTLEASGDIGIGRTDNISRSATDERSETIRSVGAQFTVLEQTRRLDADVTGDLAWMDYANDTYSDELIGSASGRVRLGLIGDHLDWVIEDRFGQVREDLFSAASPENRENVNNFSTGPDLRLSLGRVTSLLASARYTRVNYERSQADSERFGGTLAAERMLSSSARASLNVSAERIEPQDSGIDAQYKRTAAYARYALTGRRTSASFDVGANRVRGGGVGGTGLLVRLDIGRQIGTYSRLQFNVGQEYTDSGSELGLRAGQPVTPQPGSDVVVQSSQPYTSRFARLGWDITGRRTTIGLSGGWTEQDREGGESTLNQQEVTVGLRATRQLGARTDIRAGVQYEMHDYEQAGLDNDDLAYSLALTWNFARRAGLTLEGEHSRFGSDLLPTASETRYWLRLRYGERGSR